jgi:peptide/nickel transport system substrate-binding protein
LREGVTFHDGSSLDSEDVAATVRRIPAVPNSPNSFARAVRHVERVEIVSPTVFRFHTKVPDPTLPRGMASVFIIPSEYEKATTQEFNDGKAAIGTGPYNLAEWKQGESLKLIRNEKYWGKKPEWATVTEVVLPNDGARTAAILAGSVDVIDYVPVEDMKKIDADPKFTVKTAPIARIHYVALDSNRDETPHVSAGGKNPFKDMRVRKALSLAINRNAIVERLLHGLGTPAGQVLPPSFAGGSKDSKVDPYNPEAARKLLAEAGYDKGFEMTFHATNGRYPADVDIAQALAQMWTQIGLKVKVEALARTIFFPKATKFEFSIYTAQYGDDTNLRMATSMLHTRIKEQGLGNGNRSRYSNKEVDKYLDAAWLEMDESKANELTSKAIEIAMNDQGLIPLYYPGYAVASRSNLNVIVRADARNFAMNISTAK